MKRTVLIVGGTGGIGSHLVQEFGNAGYKVIFTYCHNESAAIKLGSDCNCAFYQLDPVCEENVENLTAHLANTDERIDALIYAAGIFEDALTEKMPLSSWERVLSVNLTGAFLVTKHLLPLLRQSGNGRILYIGSVMGDAGCYGSSSYAVAKAGLIALAKSVSLENAKKNVTANVLSFGYIDTGMTGQVPEGVLESAMKKIPMKRLGDPSDVAKIAVDLCANHMNYVAGQVIRVNGALYM